MVASILVGSLALAASVAQIGDAPDRLISRHGVEISNDGRVFILFAAMNALGYSTETERKGPPLEAPVFHPVRVDVRDRLRKLAADGKLDTIKNYLEKNPADVEHYLSALLSYDLALAAQNVKTDGKAKNLAGIAGLLAKLGAEPEIEKTFDAVALEQRKLSLELKQALEKDFDLARSALGIGGFRAPTDLVVIVNPLDAHATVHRVRVGPTTYLVVGPGLETARRATLEASLRPVARRWADASYGKASKLKKSWDGLRASRRITSRYSKGESYLAENLTQVLAFKVWSRGVKDVGSEEEDFIDQSAKDGLRWTRALLRALAGGKVTDDAVAAAILKASP